YRLSDRTNSFAKRVRSVRHRGNVVSDRQTEEVRLLSDRLRFSKRGVAIQIRPHSETLSLSDSLISTPTVRFIHHRVLKTPARNLVDARNRCLRMLRLQEDDNPSAELIQNFTQIRPPLGTPRGSWPLPHINRITEKARSVQFPNNTGLARSAVGSKIMPAHECPISGDENRNLDRLSSSGHGRPV